MYHKKWCYKVYCDFLVVIMSSTKAVSIVYCRLMSSAARDDDSSGPGWFSRLLVRKIDTGKESHSRLLADKETVYELQSLCIYCSTWILRILFWKFFLFFWLLLCELLSFVYFLDMSVANINNIVLNI